MVEINIVINVVINIMIINFITFYKSAQRTKSILVGTAVRKS